MLYKLKSVPGLFRHLHMTLRRAFSPFQWATGLIFYPFQNEHEHALTKGVSVTVINNSSKIPHRQERLD